MASFDDAAKLIKKLLKETTETQVKSAAKKGASKAGKAPAKKAPKKAPSKSKAPSKPKKPVKKERPLPVRPKKDFVSTKNTGIMTNDSQRRAAEKRANRYLRRAGEFKPKDNPQPTSGVKPVGRKAPSSLDVSGTRTKGMSGTKGVKKKGQYEANPDVAVIASDSAKMGRGQPKPRKVASKSVPKQKGRPAPTTRYTQDIGSELQRLRSDIVNAKNAKELAKAKQARIDFLKKRGMRSN